MPILYHHIAPSRSDGYAVTDEPELPDTISFSRGAGIGGALLNPLVFEVDFPSRDVVPHFVGMNIPVFSTQLVETLRSAGVVNFEVFSATLRNPQLGEPWEGYWAFNAIGLIAAADLERSRADTIARAGRGVVPLLAFHELVLDRQKTHNASMFRLRESPGMLLIHDHVLAHILRHRPANGWGFEATGIETV